MADLKTYIDNKGNEVQFQYVWRFVPYEASDSKFRIALHITPITDGYEFSSYRDVPELAELLRKTLVNEHGVQSRLVPAIVIYEFDEEHNDIVGFLRKAIRLLKEAGIKPNSYIDLYSGFPNIVYGEAYLEYTVSNSEASLTDIIKVMNGGRDVKEQFGTMPIVGPQSFDCDKDTDMDYLEDLLAKEFASINNRIMKLRGVVRDTMKDAHIQKSVNNLYTTENSDNYNKFQGMWI